MANNDAPRGFTPAQGHNSPASGVQIRAYDAVATATRDAYSNEAGNVYPGDPVKFTSGKVEMASSGDTIIGVCVAANTGSTNHGRSGPYDPDNLSKSYLDETEDGKVYVMLKENAVFEIQTATGVTASLFVPGYQADVTSTDNTAHGSETTGRSNVELTTASNNDVEIIEPVDTPNNDTSLVNALMLVKIL